MSGFEKPDGRLDEARLESALIDLETDALDPAERDELMALVARSPAAQRAYLEHFEMTAMLGAEAATQAEVGRLPAMPDHGQAARLFRRSVLAAAAVVALGAIVAALIHVTSPQVPELAAAAVADTRWSLRGGDLDAGGRHASVREGATVQVEAGTLKLSLRSGAAMILQGPAEVSFPKLTQPVVRRGTLWIDSGERGEKFNLQTSDLVVQNLGTRFGVRVPDDGPTEIHLIHGSLRVTRERGTDPPLELGAAEHGWTIPSLGDPSPLPLARDPFPGISALLTAPANYPTSLLGQNPTGYWRFEDADSGRLGSELPGGGGGRCRPAASSTTTGAGPGDGFAGFPASNAALDTAGGGPASLGAAPLHQGLLFEDTFGGTGPLDGRSPTVDPGGTPWVAAPNFRRDGTIEPGIGSATLAFEPVAGVIYTLEATLRDVTTPEGDYTWVALGFASGQSTGRSQGNRFIDGAVVGRAWMLFRGTGSKEGNTALLAGNSDREFWNGWSGGVGGDIELRIVLDTTGGAGTWNATWFARRPGAGPWVKVRDTCRLPNEAIQSVGFATTGDRQSGRIDRFSLRARPADSGDPADSRAEGPARMTRGRGAVSWWLRREPGVGRSEILWSAGEGIADDAVHARLEDDGRVGLFIENGRFDVSLTSEETVDDGRWHHLVASWGPMSAALYLDGRRVAHDPEFLGMPQGFLPELRVAGGPVAGAAGFNGSIDEVACWDRALTPLEVERQFESAIGAEPR